MIHSKINELLFRMDNRSYEIIKRLTDKFFQGTISPEETDCILDMASHIPESELEKIRSFAATCD